MGKQFQVGKRYETTSNGDSNCWIPITVLARTAKTIRAQTKFDGAKTFRIRINRNGDESIRPWGSFSLCPTLSADEVTP